MPRFVVDTSTVLHLASEGLEVSSDHELLAPTPPTVPDAVGASRGRPSRRAARGRRARPPGAHLADQDRLLGDAVLRRRAREVAERMGWADTYTAEYIALTQLQADAFMTLDAKLARSVEGIVATASIDELR